MKKKLALLALAMALPLAACGKEESNEAGPSAQELALAQSYGEFAKLTMGERQATEMQPFLANGAHAVSSAEVDIQKVYTHILSIGQKASTASSEIVAVTSILGEVSQMKTEGLIDDTVYYFLGFGDGMLKAAAQMGGATDSDVVATLSKIDTEVDAIATNVCGVIDAVLNVYAEVPTFLLSAMQAVNTSTYVINPDGLKSAISGLSSLVGKLLPAKANLAYLSDFVLPIVNVVADVPEEANIVFKYVKLSDVIGVAFDAIGFVTNALATLDEDYYTYLGTIDTTESPVEQIAYAVLGAVEHIKYVALDMITDAKVSAAVDKVLQIGVGIATEICAANQVTIPDDVMTMLQSSKPKALFMAEAQLLLDALELNLKTVNAESLAKLSVYVYKAFFQEVPAGQQVDLGFMDDLVDSVYAILCELAEEKEQIGGLIFDIFDVYHCGYEILYDISNLVVNQDNIQTFFILVMVDALIDEEEGYRGEIKDILLDVVVVVKDLFSSFVTTDQLEADVNIVEFISAIVAGEFGMEQLLQLNLNEARIAYVDDLLEDIYSFLDGEDLVDTVMELIVDALGIQEPTIEDQDDFVNYFYGIVKSILVEGEFPEVLTAVEIPQD